MSFSRSHAIGTLAKLTIIDCLPDIKRPPRRGRPFKYIPKTKAPSQEMIFDPPIDRKAATEMFESRTGK